MGARLAIPEILELFKEYEIHVTWAAVGIMLQDSKEQIENNKPKHMPKYSNPKCSAYNHLEEIGNSEYDDKFHYGQSLIELIKEYDNQEIGTHTYSHYYCLEKGADIKSFEDDITKARNLMRNKYNIDVASIVFPRNQYSDEHINAVKRLGIDCFRGNPRNGYDYKKYKVLRFLQRVFRYIDNYIPNETDR